MARRVWCTGRLAIWGWRTRTCRLRSARQNLSPQRAQRSATDVWWGDAVPSGRVTLFPFLFPEGEKKSRGTCGRHNSSRPNKKLKPGTFQSSELSTRSVYFCRGMLGLLLVNLLLPCALGQAKAGVRYEGPLGSRSLYFDRPVFHPEALSGVWETPDGKGGAVGIELKLTTAVMNFPIQSGWSPMHWRGLEVGVFERSGPEIEVGDANFFMDTARGGARLEQDRLQIHFRAREKWEPSFDIDLVLQRDDCWHGRFHRGTFDRVVTLCRPAPGQGAALSPFVGTWLEISGANARCVHIAQTGRGTFVGWSDWLQVPGRAKYARGVSRPGKLLEFFGALDEVKLAGRRVIDVEFGDYGICAGLCQYSFFGRLSADGNKLRGKLAGYSVTFSKMPGDSCVNPGLVGK